MRRVAIYGRAAPGRAGKARLDRPAARLAAKLTRQPSRCHTATCGDLNLGPASGHPRLSRLLTGAPGLIDAVVVDGYRRLSANHAEPGALLAHLGALGVHTVVLRPSGGRRLARLVANFALADLIGTTAR